MNWLLISPTHHFLKMFPLGIAYVSAALKNAGVTVNTLDLNFVPQDGESINAAIHAAASDSSIKVIGIGALYAEHHHIRNLIAICRRANPSARIVVGNGVVSCDPAMMLPALGADLAVVGEGEETVVALHKALVSGGNLAEVEGIAFRTPDGVVVTHPRKAIMDIDSIAMPDYDGFDVKRYIESQKGSSYYGYSFIDSPRSLPILASRSCPFSCTFCYHTISTYRKRSLDSFFAEIEYLTSRYDVNLLQIYDDLFAVNRDRVVEFCERMKSYGLSWYVSLRVQNVAPGKIDLPVLLQMKDAGCRMIGLGLESVSPTILDSMKKKTTAQQMDCALDMITRAGINFQGNFIFGDAAETLETANETLDYWRRNRHYAIQTDPIWVFPGTPLYKQSMIEGRIPPVEKMLALSHPVLNVSRLDDDTYNMTLDTLNIIRQYLNNIPGQVHSITPTIVNDEGRQFFTSTCGCPHCGEQSTYTDHAFWRRLICRHCGGLFDIPVARLIGRRNQSAESTATLQQAADALATGDAGRAFALARPFLFADHCEDRDARALVGAALVKAGFIGAATDHLKQALAANPEDGPTCNNLGICLYANNRVALALLMFRHAILLEDRIPEAEANAKIALAHLGGDDHVWDLVHGIGRPPLPVAHLLVAAPRIEPEGSNVSLRTPLRVANGQPVVNEAELAAAAVAAAS